MLRRSTIASSVIEQLNSSITSILRSVITRHGVKMGAKAHTKSKLPLYLMSFRKQELLS
jgi:hypothetical protein